MNSILTVTNGIILVSTLLLYYINSRIFQRLINRNNSNLTINFLFNFCKVLIVLIGIFMFLSQYEQFEKVVNVLMTNSALIVAVLGFTLQSTLKNILAGMMLLSSEAFKIGDRIRIPEKKLTGVIKELTLRHTTIQMATNEIAIIPNSVLNEAVVINNDLIENETSYPLVVKIKIDKDVSLAKKIIEKAIEDNNTIINKELSKVTVSHIETDSIELKVMIWNRNIELSFSEITNLKLVILEEFRKKNII